MEELIMSVTNGRIDSFQCSVLFRLIFAAICGGLIGVERDLKGRPAGLKTFSLVCVGATLSMVTNEYISIYVNGGTGDTARMAAQVISGIGFLGAGTIMVTGGNRITGLTTAAALWLTAALGITIGTGFYFGAVMAMIVVFVFSAWSKLFHKFFYRNSRFMKLCVVGVKEEFVTELLEYFFKNDIHMKNMARTSEYKWYKEDICFIMELDLRKRKEHKFILQEIEQMDGFRFLNEIG